MRVGLPRILCLLAVLCGCRAAIAQQPDPLAMQRRIAQLERTVAELRQPRVARVGYYDALENPPGDVPALADEGPCLSGDCAPAARVGRDFFNVECPGSGLVFGAEVAFLKPFATNGDVPGALVNYGGLNDISVGNSFQYEVTPRVWLGWVSPTGLGTRARYWEFDHSESAPLLIDSGVLRGSIEVRTIDWEITKQVEFRNWRFLAFGGLRYAEVGLHENFDFTGGGLNLDFDVNNGFDGIGLTGGMETTASLFNTSAIQWYTGFRGSVLFGNRKYGQDFAIANFRDDAFLNIDDDVLPILELQTGPQLRYRLANGAEFFARGGFEGQIWLNSGTAFSSPFDNSLGSLGFAGFTVATGLLW